MSEFEWDSNKNCTNIAKHGIDFDDAISIFLNSTYEREDDRYLTYTEVRIVAYGETSGHVLAVVYTMRGDVCRIISARKANRNERDAYYAAISERPPDWSD